MAISSNAPRRLPPYELPRSSWTRRVLWEGRITWGFLRYDVSSAIVPAILFTVAAWTHQGGSSRGLLGVLGRGALYFCLYLYTFCLANQLTGIEEDRLNKPDRPIVSGLVTQEGARVRWWLGMLAFTLAGGVLGVLRWALLWEAVVVAHNQGGVAKHWFAKNLCMAVGIVAQLAAAWSLVAPIPPVVWRWSLSLAAVIFFLVPLQDLRDLEGDRAMGRRTFPMVFGEAIARPALAIGFALLPIVVHVALLAPVGWTPRTAACELGLGLMSALISARILLLRSRRADHRTYLLFTFWYCLVLASAIVVL